LDVKAQVEVAFRPASEFFVFDLEPALTGGKKLCFSSFSAACFRRATETNFSRTAL
jgi:hypothetical protein